ncbi:hypothetical protein FRC01_006486 [Tulasnella sp. 417]|nr:hypothetical protein FRC01_006486 [Tulasnella sp. 417]
MGRLGLERSSAVGRVREKLIRAVHSFSLWGSSKSRDKAWIRNETLRLIEEEPLLIHLLPTGSLPHRTQHKETNSGLLPCFTPGSLVSIKVQSCLYSLPITYFQSLNSELPSLLKKHGSEGVVVLPSDVSRSDWEIFLEVVTARPYDDPPLSLSFPKWVGGLRVAKLMEHDDASNYIREEIETKCLSEDVVDLLETAIKLEFPDTEWLQGRFAALANRKRNISAEEVLRLGAKGMETVCRLREQAAYERGKASVAEAGELEVNVSKPSEPEVSVPEARELEVNVPEATVRKKVGLKKDLLKKASKKR